MLAASQDRSTAVDAAREGLSYHNFRRFNLRLTRGGVKRPQPISECFSIDVPGYFNAFQSSTSFDHPNRPLSRRSSFPKECSSALDITRSLSLQEDGAELLPAYSCSLRAESIFQRKMEIISPFDKAEKRAWTRVFVVLKGTMLNIHKVRDPGLFTRINSTQQDKRDQPLGTQAGRLLRTYTLQHAEVGIAIDYQKQTFVPRALFKKLCHSETADERALYQQRNSYVIRIRVETDQFLLNCVKMETFLYWLECLSAVIDLALPLEERSLPRHRTIPVRRRRQADMRLIYPIAESAEISLPLARPLRLESAFVESSAATECAEALWSADQSATPTSLSSYSLQHRWSNSVQSVFRTLSRPLSEVSTLNRAKRRRSINSTASISIWPEEGTSNMTRETPSSENLRNQYNTAQSQAARWRTVTAQQLVDAYDGEELVIPEDYVDSSVLEGMDEAYSSRHSSFASDDKWCPSHNWTYARHIRYARRCMPNLWDNAPRQSDIIVKDGGKWRICWDMSKLVKIEPRRLPNYDEVMDGVVQVRPQPEARAILCFGKLERFRIRKDQVAARAKHTDQNGKIT